MLRRGILNSRRGSSRPILVLAAIWLLDQLITFVVGRPTDRFGDPEDVEAIVTLLSFLQGFLVPVLVALGLIYRMRFAWVIALIWQAISGAFGILTFTLGSYGWNDVTSMSEAGFYGGALPIAIALISFVLLLLPSTQRWMRQT